MKCEPARKHKRRYRREEPVDNNQGGDRKCQRKESGKRDAQNGSGQTPPAEFRGHAEALTDCAQPGKQSLGFTNQA
jgi:hypothetical protein